MAHKRSTAAAGMATCLGLALFAGACGSSPSEQTKSAAKVWADAKKAMAGTKDFDVSGTVTNSGNSVSLDVAMAPNRGGGTITIGGQVVNVVVAAATVYLKTGKAGWEVLTGNATESGQLAGGWVKAPETNKSFTGFANLTSSTKFVTGLSPSGSLTKAHSAVTWRGQQAVELTDHTGAHIYVANSGKPYILTLDGGSSSSSGSLIFSSYGKAHLPSAPAGAKAFPNT